MAHNISYLFNKSYYHDVGLLRLDWTNKEDAKNDQNKKFFDKKNQEIFNQPVVETVTFETIDVEDKTTTSFCLETTYPGLLYGSGNTHEAGALGEIKLGFQLDFTSGMPIIMGSGIKGVIRSYFPSFETDSDPKIPKLSYTLEECKTQEKYSDKIKELNQKKNLAIFIARELKWFSETDYENLLQQGVENETVRQICKAIHLLEIAVFNGIDISDSKDTTLSIYCRDVFHESVPIVSRNKNGVIFGPDSITPHVKDNMSYEKSMLKNPVPLSFMKVLPGVVFRFNFQLFNTEIKLYDSDYKRTVTKTDKAELFKTLLTTFGIGAKTNVGYGQFNYTDLKNNPVKTTTITEKIVEEKTTTGEKKLIIKRSIPPQEDDKSKNPPPPQKLPQAKTMNLMSKGSVWEGKVTEIEGEYSHFEIEVNKEIIPLRKKTEKIEGRERIKIGVRVEIFFNDNYDFKVPNFKAKIKE